MKTNNERKTKMKTLIINAIASIVITALTGCSTPEKEMKATVNSPSGRVEVKENTWYVLERKTSQYVVLSWNKDEFGEVNGVMAKRVGHSNEKATAYTVAELESYLGNIVNQDIDSIFRFNSISTKGGCLSIIEKSYKELSGGSSFVTDNKLADK